MDNSKNPRRSFQHRVKHHKNRIKPFGLTTLNEDPEQNLDSTRTHDAHFKVSERHQDFLEPCFFQHLEAPFATL